MNMIILQPYDSRWPQLFEVFRSRFAAALDGMIAAIDHVGSTSVPGLAAKPVIDIDVLLKSETDLPATVSKLASLGYTHQGDLGIQGREAFQTPSQDFPHHLYVCAPGSEEYQRHLAFRNYLRSHAEEADAYGTLKHELAARFPDDREAYTKAKGEFIAKILQRAQ
jgi:GrpB-like predicted nucleotidyltransferase (UPF0157 family)